MGVYMVSIDTLEWLGTDEVSFGELAAALNRELFSRGLPSYEPVPGEVPFARGSGLAFEEKLSPSMDGFGALCEAHLTAEEMEMFSGWSVLVPVSLEEEIWLPLHPWAGEESMIAGAWQVLALAERLATAIDLPSEVPQACDNLDLTMWFRDQATDLAVVRPGPWSADLDAAFYVAVYLRAAQHSLRRGCPILCTW
jgi:hypothetical protein